MTTPDRALTGPELIEEWRSACPREAQADIALTARRHGDGRALADYLYADLDHQHPYGGVEPRRVPTDPSTPGFVSPAGA